MAFVKSSRVANQMRLGDHDGLSAATPEFSFRKVMARLQGYGPEELAEFVLAMKHGLGLNKILDTIHTYPTLAEANKYVTGEWNRAHAPQKVLAWLERFHAWRRGA